MRHLKAMSGVALAMLLAAGCSVETAESPAELASGELGAAEALTTDEALAAPSAADLARESGELARIDFSDGNSVRFEKLDGGVLVTEIGSDLNQNHLVPSEGLSAVEAFRALAPGREVPAALLQMHELLYPAGSELAAQAAQIAVPVEATEGAELPMDEDLEHNGQFQQAAGSYPSATFIANMCNFPNTAPNYRQINNSVAHTQSTPNINTAYFAVASDIGIITAKACSNNNCGGSVTLQAGYHSSGFYDAGLKCDKSCPAFGLFGCVTICSNKKVKFDVVSNKISSSVRFHECASFTK